MFLYEVAPNFTLMLRTAHGLHKKADLDQVARFIEAVNRLFHDDELVYVSIQVGVIDARSPEFQLLYRNISS